MKINERFLWALKVLNPEPSENGLEIGCGTGIFAGLIASMLTSGKITALDKSDAMIRKASKRNKKFEADGRASFLTVDFANSDFTKEAFDKIVAFNVNFFSKNPIKELELICRYLKKEGSLYIFYQTPGGIDEKFTESLTTPLLSNFFEIQNVFVEDINAIRTIGIVAKPIR